MKKIVTLSLASAMALFATNGDNLIGLGAQSRAMGGVGIATFHGAENVLSNPALIAKSKGGEVAFGATYFAPSVKANGEKSDADTNVIPEVSVSEQINDAWAYGIGMYGSAGMGVDYRDYNGRDPYLNMKARTNLQLMKFAPALAYHTGGFAIGVAPVVQYGNLDIAYQTQNPQNGQIQSVGMGSSEDFGLGFEAGITYDILENLRVGAVYKSSISMTYDHTLSVASRPFAPVLGGTMSDDLEQPSEFGLGLSYDMDAFTFAFDYKRIQWSDADGYKDFGWDDQDVYAFGAKYDTGDYWVGLGFNYAENPVPNYSTTPGMNPQAVLNTFNYLMFPATEETHYSFGGGMKVTEHLSLDGDVVYAPEKTVNTTGFAGPLEIKHQETSVAFSMRYNF